ncbi:MAG: thioredoxin family protein, partial [Achromobacter mucicolens]
MTDPRFDPAQVFQVFGMRHVDTAGFDAAVVQAPGADLRC